MKNKFYIMTALVISLTGCSNIEDGTQPTGNFPEDHIIRVVTEVKAPVSRAGYDASNLESFGLIIHNSENIAYDYNSQMVNLIMTGIRRTGNKCFGIMQELR